jgi:ferredoxin
MSTPLDVVAREAAKCVTCGLCNEVCPTFAATRRETDGPRGRVHFLRELATGTDTAGLVYLEACVCCDLCSEICPTAVDFGAAVRSYRAAAGFPARGPDDLLALSRRPDLDQVEARYFAALVQSAARARTGQPIGAFGATALVPGPALAALRPDVVDVARRRHAPDAIVLTTDPGTGLLELGFDGVFAKAAAGFAAEVRARGVREVVCLDPWSRAAAERALGGDGAVRVRAWTALLTATGYVLADDGAVVVDVGPEPLDTLARLAAAIPPERILPPDLRAHVSSPAFDSTGRAVQRSLRARVAELLGDRRLVACHPLALLAYPRAELAGAGPADG